MYNRYFVHIIIMCNQQRVRIIRNSVDVLKYTVSPPWKQGRIKPPKAVRGHATLIDGKMLSVTKYRIQILLV